MREVPPRHAGLRDGGPEDGAGDETREGASEGDGECFCGSYRATGLEREPKCARLHRDGRDAAASSQSGKVPGFMDHVRSEHPG